MHTPSDWSRYKLGDISRIIRGASPRPKGDPRFYGGPVPRLMVEDVSRDGKVVYPSVDSLTLEGAKRSRPCPAGTLTMVCSGVVGVPSFLGVDACIHDGFIALVDISDRFSKDFIYHQLLRLQAELDASATHGGVFTNLTTKGVADFEFYAPDNLTEQEAIAEALSDADAFIEGLERLIAKKRLIKQGAMQDLLTAKRRLPGFSGEWGDVSLGERGRFFKGSGVRKDQAATGELPCVRYGELYTQHDDVVRDFVSFISPEVANTAQEIKSGDILFAGSGETKAEIGKCAVVTYEGTMYAGGDIIIFRPEHDNPTFLSYMLNSPLLQQQKARRGQGDAVVHISSAALSNLHLKLPSLDEQSSIAVILEDMEAEIQAIETRLGKARQVKEGMMQNLLTGRIRLV